MMKRSIQWFGALILVVVGALAFVACSNNDSDGDGGGGGVPDNSKILGTWVVKQVTPNDMEGPRVGMEITFKSDGSFTSGEHDSGKFTYNSETGAFNAVMNDMIIAGTFTVNGDKAICTVNVTADGETRTYMINMSKKGSEPEKPALSSTKMVGTWKVMKDSNPDESQVGKTAVFNENGTCTWGGKSYTYTCEEQEDGSLAFEMFDGDKQVTDGVLVLVNNGNVLNGKYVYAQTSIQSVVCGVVLKKPDYNYPTSGVQGRWQFTYVAQPFGGYDDYFAERLPVSDYNREDGGDVFVIGDNGELYVEGDPYVGNYSFGSNNLLKLQFAGKYVAYVQGLIEFSGDDTMTIPQGRGTFKSSATSGETIGFRGTIQRVIE